MSLARAFLQSIYECLLVSGGWPFNFFGSLWKTFRSGFGSPFVCSPVDPNRGGDGETW